MKRLSFFLLLCVFMAGCASSEPVQKSNLTAGMVKTKIVKGQTTQNEILEVFGAPNVVTQNKTGNEVWTYDKVSMEQSGSDAYGTLILVGTAKAKVSSSTRTFTLMIEFNKNNIVEEYSYRSAAF